MNPASRIGFLALAMLSKSMLKGGIALGRKAARMDGKLIIGRPPGQPGRNRQCPCGSGKKFKRCCGGPRKR